MFKDLKENMNIIKREMKDVKRSKRILEMKSFEIKM